MHEEVSLVDIISQSKARLDILWDFSVESIFVSLPVLLFVFYGIWRFRFIQRCRSSLFSVSEFRLSKF